jgi:hypothetical protein
MQPSKDWHRAADAAIGYVAIYEGRPVTVAEVNALRDVGYETYEKDGGLAVRRRGA